jgi:hypothetical protein
MTIRARLFSIFNFPFSIPRTAALTIALSLLLAQSLSASCVLQLRYENGAVRWTPIAGATRYQIQESFDSFATSRNDFTLNPVHAVKHRVSAPAVLEVRVTAEIDPAVTLSAATAGPSVPACTSTIRIELDPDPAFRTLTRRIIFPLTGSTPGAFGGRFKTSLRLVASVPGQKGRVIFHPAGKPASDNDPSLDYAFASTGDVRVFDDIVAELGQSGIGSLDIVPDPAGDATVRRAEVRLFNETASGTFGTNAMPVYPFDYLRVERLQLDAPDARFRLNVGFRALTDAVVTVLVYGADRRLRDFRELRFPAGWMQMTSASEVAGSPLAAGESMILTFGGSIIPDRKSVV